MINVSKQISLKNQAQYISKDIKNLLSIQKFQTELFNSNINSFTLNFKLPYLNNLYKEFYDQNCSENHIGFFMILLLEICNGIIGVIMLCLNLNIIDNKMVSIWIASKLLAIALEILSVFHHKIKIIDYLLDFIPFIALTIGDIGSLLFSLNNNDSLKRFHFYINLCTVIQFILFINLRSLNFLNSLITFQLTFLIYYIQQDYIIFILRDYEMARLIGFIILEFFFIPLIYHVHAKDRKSFFDLHILVKDFQNTQEILENLPISIIIANQSEISYMNKYTRKLFQTSEKGPEETLSTILIKEKNQISQTEVSLLNYIKKPIKKQKNCTFETNQNNTNKILETVKISIMYNSEFQFLTAFHDITAVQKANKEQIQKKFELLIVNTLTHNFRTPINCILGSTEFILSTFREIPVNLEKIFQKIHQQSLMLFDMIDNIHEYFAYKNNQLCLDKSIFNPSEIVKSVLELFKDEFSDKRISISLNISPELPTNIYNDSKKYRQILVALVTNAIKFSQHNELRIHLSFNSETKFLKSILEDNGVGIAQGKLKNILTSFSKIDEDIREGNENIGFGIGLPLSNSFCKAIGGKQIEIESILNVGTRVTFYTKDMSEDYNGNDELSNLLMNSEENQRLIISPEIEEKSSNRNSYALESIRNFKTSKILLVDDAESNIYVLQMYAERSKIEFDIAHNGKEAFEIYRSSLENVVDFEYKIIFTDINMPIMDGIEATKEIRKLEASKGKHVVIIGITANMDLSVKRLCQEAGMDLFKTKPYSYKDFCNVISRIN